ncbi:MAG: hypothetical protein ABI425_04005 [Patescibacteria group bacterium]
MISFIINSNNYLQKLSGSSETPSFILQKFSVRIDKSIQSMKVFDKTFFLKSEQLTVALIYFDKRTIRFFKMLSTILTASICALVLSLIIQKVSPLFMLIGFIVGASIGLCLPEFYIQDKMKTHQFLLYQAVPTFLEQFHMITSSTGYESFPQALRFIAPNFPGALGDELRRLIKVQRYLSGSELLDRFVIICPHPLLKELSISIRVSNQYGTSLTNKTQSLVETAQLLREQHTKDLANKTSGVLLGPLLLFHLPALLIIFLIPFIFVLQKGL